MAGGVEELLGMLYEMVQNAFSLPFGSDRCILDKDKLLGLVDEISTILPTDLKQARSIVEGRNDIISAAKREAEAIKRQAEERARQLVSQEEVLLVARQKANDIVLAAETKAKEMRRAANEYVDNTLKRTETALAEALNEVRASRAEFRSAAAGSGSGPSERTGERRKPGM